MAVSASDFNHNWHRRPEEFTKMWAGDFPSRRTASPGPETGASRGFLARQSQFLANPANFVLKKMPSVAAI